MALTRIFWLAILFVLRQMANAQSNTQLMVKRVNGGVLLRWQPDDFSPERLSGRYFIERSLVRYQGRIWPVDSTVLLNELPVACMPDSIWQRLALTIPEAGLLMECMKLQSGGSRPADFADAEQMRKLCSIQSQVLMMRYFDLALLAGLAFRDMTADQAAEYLYTLKDAGSGIVLAAAYCPVSTPLPEPAVPVVAVQNEYPEVTIIPSDNAYFGWMVERAAGDTGTFISLSSEPWIASAPPGKQPLVNISDTAVKPGQACSYRVRGLDVFGYPGPWSDTVRVDVAHPLVMSEIYVSGDTFFWESRQTETAVTITPQRADSIQGEFSQILPESKLNKGHFRAGQTGYYRIAVKAETGKEIWSDAIYIRIADTTAPVNPVWVSGNCDDSGHVILRWNKSMAEAGLQYRIYRSHARQFEPSLLTGYYLQDTQYIDSVYLLNRADSMYYALVAVDLSYNESVKSWKAVALPDKIPPPEPRILSWKFYPGFTQICWNHLRYHGVAKYHVSITTRVNESEVKYALNAENKDTMTLTDSTFRHEPEIGISLKAEDASGNTSPWSPRFWIKQPESSGIPGVNDPQVVTDSTRRMTVLLWDYPALPGLSHFRIYEYTTSWTTLGTAAAADREYLIRGGTAAKRYRIVAYMHDGRKSP